MARKPQPIEYFARALEAISLARKKCSEGKDPKSALTAVESAENNLVQGLQAYKDRQTSDAQFFSDVSAYSILRNADCEKADEVLKKLQG